MMVHIDKMAVAPISYRHQPYTAKKNWIQGTHRICSPEETYARIEPCFPTIGLTRLANITGLDRIGIPIVLAIRPNAGYLAVDAGKGFTLVAAKVSAAMESIERYHGETINLPEMRLPYKELESAGYATIPIDRFPYAKHYIFNEHQPERWVMGWDISNQEEVAVPAATVFMKRFKWPRSELVPFQATSNGLASGNHLLEAIAAGLLEVIERDATTCWQLAIETFFTNVTIPRVRLETIEYPTVQEMLSRFDAANVEAILVDCTIDTQVPTYLSWIYDRDTRGLGAYKGYGTHLDSEVAMLRALTEAAQSRLIFIAGARDDAYRYKHNMLKKYDASSRQHALFEQIPAVVDARERVSESTPTFEGDIQILLEKLRRVGLEQVIVLDFSLPGFDVSVVRVITPGLEGYKGVNFYKPAQRAMSFLRQLQQEVQKP